MGERVGIALKKALSFLKDCTLNEECLENHFSDILSAWWNIATFPKHRKSALLMMKSDGIIRNLKVKLQHLSECVNSGNSRCSIELVLILFNAKRYGVQVPSPSAVNKLGYEINYPLLGKMVVRELKMIAPWHNQGIYDDIPPGSMDFLLVN